MRIIPAPKARTGAGGKRPRREIVPVPDTLRNKALAFDTDTVDAIAAAVADATAAEVQVRASFATHLADEIARLARGANAHSTSPGDEAVRGRLFRAAHRLRDCAPALDAPLIARLAASLARLVERPGRPTTLVLAHVDALRAAERRGTPPDDPVAAALATELEAAVSGALAKAARTERAKASEAAVARVARPR